MNEPHPEDPAWETIAPYLDEAMYELTEKDRSAVTLRFFQDKPLKEVGAALGIGGGSSLASSTLKVMAWAKVKTSAVIIGAVLATGTGATLVAYQVLDRVEQRQAPVSGTRLRLPTGHLKPIVALGRWHGTILAPDGSLWPWGQNTDGWPVLGLGGTASQPALQKIETAHQWQALGTSDHHNLAIRDDGTLWGWGENIHGQVGDGSSGRGNAERDTPVESASGNDWKEVAAGGSHGLGLRKDGTLWAWGRNAYRYTSEADLKCSRCTPRPIVLSKRFRGSPGVSVGESMGAQPSLSYEINHGGCPWSSAPFRKPTQEAASILLQPGVAARLSAP